MKFRVPVVSLVFRSSGDLGIERKVEKHLTARFDGTHDLFSEGQKGYIHTHLISFQNYPSFAAYPIIVSCHHTALNSLDRIDNRV